MPILQFCNSICNISIEIELDPTNHNQITVFTHRYCITMCLNFLAFSKDFIFKNLILQNKKKFYNL